MTDEKMMQIEDAEIVSEETRKEESSAYMIVRRILADEARQEGIKLPLPEDGKLTPDIVNGFLGDAYVTKLPDGRTIVLSTRLINNYIITESYTAASIADFDENYAIRVCQAKTKNKLLEMLEFLWACATYTPEQVAEEQAHLASFAPTGEVEPPAPVE